MYKGKSIKTRFDMETCNIVNLYSKYCCCIFILLQAQHSCFIELMY